MMLSSEADPDFLHPTWFANDLDIHRRAADFAILDGGVIALGGISGRGDDFTAMGALDLDFDEHD
jgi:hypothetical protein